MTLSIKVKLLQISNFSTVTITKYRFDLLNSDLDITYNNRFKKKKYEIDFFHICHYKYENDLKTIQIIEQLQKMGNPLSKKENKQ